MLLCRIVVDEVDRQLATMGDMAFSAESAGVADLPPGTREGFNDCKREGWGGLCPPVGRHRYFFRLYALDTELPDLGLATKNKVLQAMYWLRHS